MDILEKIKTYNENCYIVDTPISIDLIEKFEFDIGVKLPKDYKEMLHLLNGFTLLGTIVYGIHYKEKTECLYSVYNYEHGHSLYEMPKEFIPISPDGRGNHFCLNTSKTTKDSCEIIFWVRGYNYSLNDLPEKTHDSFTAWLNEEVFEWVSENYDSEGNDK